MFSKHRFLSGLFLYLSRGKRIIFTRDIMNKKLLELLQDKCKDFGLTKKAIEDLKITWPQILNAQNTPSELYGFNGIPHIILFGPDGTIVARDLRGDALKAKVKEMMQ